tara:strand:- start:3975 stop:5036 length:1062 start_codon:yes stop_codon:yes gene_type:complete
MNLNIKLIFPSRSVDSSDNIQELNSYYDFKEQFDVQALEHNLPFKDDNNKKALKSLRFNISHYLWAKKNVKLVIKNERRNETYITRSDWIYYFLSKANKRVVFECHQVSKVRRWVINRVQKNKYSYIVFTNLLLKKEFKINKNFENRTLVLHNGFDNDYFGNTSLKKEKKRVIFVGKLLRFEKDRNINFLIKAFTDSRLDEFKFIIVGGPNDYKDILLKEIEEKEISNVEFLGNLPRRKTLNEIQKSEIGILINTNENMHSIYHTSPIKYFEYLKAKLKIVAVDFPSHRNLPMSNVINFFENNNLDSFVNSVVSASNSESYDALDEEVQSVSERTKTIIEFVARPEGLEPPTL